MNNIKRLQEVEVINNATQAAVQNELRNLRSYLTSSKFHQDTTVQVQDVLNRLDNIEAVLTRKEDTLDGYDTLNNAVEWNNLTDQYVFCIDLMGRGADTPGTNDLVDKLEARFEAQLKFADIEINFPKN